MAEAASEIAVVGDENAPVYGLLAEFRDVPALYAAIGAVRDAGFRKWDAYAPVPVHGADEQMGLPGSKIAWITGTFAAIGLAAAVALQWWTSAVDYPLIVAGKPFWAWEQFTPIMFEVAVLFGGIATIVGMLAINGLPRYNHPLFESDAFLRASDDKFFIAIEAKDPQYERAAEVLRSLDPVHIEEVRA
jgi:hypothetical protein